MTTLTEQPTWSATDGDAGDEPASHEQPDPGNVDDDQQDDAHAGDQAERPASVGEVQKIRARAREAEAERDTLRVRVERLQLREVETIAARHLADASDLLLIGGVTLDGLVGDDGEVDAAAVVAACKALVETRGERFARRRTTSVSPDGGVRGTAVGRVPATLAEALAASWQQERQR